MSLRNKRIENAGESVLDYPEAYYHIPVLVALMLAMLAIRLQSYESFIRGGEV